MHIMGKKILTLGACSVAAAIALPGLLGLGSCKAPATASAPPKEERTVAQIKKIANREPPEGFVRQPGQFALPKKVAYKTNGDYSDRVAATYDSTTGTFTYFPDPSDITAASAPRALEDGWLLDCQGGIGENTVFLRWTYDEYSRLPRVPSLEELRDAIIPEAKVTEIRILEYQEQDHIQ